MKIQFDELLRLNIGNSSERFYLILTDMINSLKQKMYSLSSYKETLDIMNTEIQNILRSSDGNFLMVNDIQDRMNDLNEKMNIEFERIIMTTESKMSNLDNDFRKTAQGHDEDYSKVKVPEPEVDEEVEFERISKYIDEGVSTLRLNRETIKNMPKIKSNKFILPLEASKVEDIEKFMHLTKQPFSFLNYNGAQFSVNLNTGVLTMWDDAKDESKWLGLVTNNVKGVDHVKKLIETKKQKIIERQKRIGKAYHKLSDQIDYLKEQFEKKANRFPNASYTKFIASRTADNIKTVREAEAYSKRQLEVLKNKRLISNPIAFFERAVTLFLGETGVDIIHDLEQLGYTNRDDHTLAIRYLYFMLRIVNRDDDYVSPIVAIMDSEEFNIGFEKSPILKVIAGHMFVHTVSIVKDYKEPEIIKVKPPETRFVSDFKTGSTGPR